MTTLMNTGAGQGCNGRLL